MIVQLNVVLNRTVVLDSDWCFDNLFGSHLQSQSEFYHVSWWYLTLIIDLIDQLSRDVIGRLSVKPWCYWLWRLVMSLMCFDPSIVTIKQTFIVNQIVSCPVVLSWLVLHDPTNKSFVRRFSRTPWLTERGHTAYQGDRGKWYNAFSRLLGHSRQQQTTNDKLQKTDTYRQITRPVIVQPDLSQGYNYTDFDETSATSLRLTWQPTRRDWLPKQRF